MTTLQRSIVLLFEQPSNENAAEMAADSCEEHFDSRECNWRFSNVLPQDMPISSADQLSAFKRDAGPNAIYLIIEKE